MYCNNCGCYNEEKAKFCTNCGSRLSNNLDLGVSNTYNQKRLSNNTNIGQEHSLSDNSYNENNDLDLFGVDTVGTATINTSIDNKFLIISCISFLVFLLSLLSTRLFNIYSYHAPDSITIVCIISYIVACIFMAKDFCRFKSDLKFLGVIFGIVSILAVFNTGYFGQYMLMVYYCFRFFYNASFNIKHILLLALIGIIMIVNLFLHDKVFVSYNNEQKLVSAKDYNIEYKDLFSSNIDSNKKGSSNDYKNDYAEKETENVVSDTTVNDSSDGSVLDNIDITPYNYITVKDLDSYSSDILGKQVLIIDTISSVNSSSDSKNIQILVPDTYHDMTCYLASDSNINVDKLSSHNYIAIVGVVDNPTDAYFFKSPNLINCYVVAYGNDAYSLYTNYTETSTSLSSFFTSQSTEQQSSENDVSNLSESDFKLSCEVIDASSYNDILRNPDNYKKNVKFTGVVDQTLEGWFGSYTLYLTDSNGNKWGITYSYKDGESHKLEGDSITVYGLLDGTQTTKTVLGKQVTLPYISADYIE